MNVVGIIAEYNPMHNGHIYHIEQAKKLANADVAIVVMSGSFTEQGNISVINKFDRAKIAIQNGADIVIELPTIFATSSAEDFAYGAIKLLNNLNVVTHIAFGAEAKNLNILQKIASIQIKNNDVISFKIKENMAKGITYAKAQDMVVKELLDEEMYNEFNKPNNILAVEYLKALIRLKSQIKPVLVERLESSHNNQKIANSSNYVSSTAIREILSIQSDNKKSMLLDISKYIPQNVCEYIATNDTICNENIWNNLKYKITSLGISGLKDIAEVSEGLENRLYEKAVTSTSYNEYIFSIKTKCYTLSKIKRICIYILLDITKELKANIKDTSYARILKCNNPNLLSHISKNATIPIITKINDEIIDKQKSDLAYSLKLDILSHNIAYPNKMNLDYYNNISVI